MNVAVARVVTKTEATNVNFETKQKYTVNCTGTTRIAEAGRNGTEQKSGR